MTFAPDLPGDVFVGEAVEGQKDHPRPLGNGLGQVPERTIVCRTVC